MMIKLQCNKLNQFDTLRNMGGETAFTEGVFTHQNISVDMVNEVHTTVVSKGWLKVNLDAGFNEPPCP